MTWFKDWFNSPYYHILYKNRDIKEAQTFIDNLIKKLKIKKNTKILDVACGKGRHAIYLNKKGMNVTGIDLSKNSINNAKKYENNKLQFKVHDMREVFQKNTFNIATNLFTSLGYFTNIEDEKKTLNAIALSLKKEGILIIDFMNSKKVIQNLVKSEDKKVGDICFKISRSFKDNFIIKSIQFENNNQKHSFREKVRGLTLTDFYELIKHTDLKIINVFGNYRLEPFKALNSERLIIICQK